ncbi:hypothetical protein WR25_01229 [Diploscapter pachys]|uniref:RING-type domain-containing protein n=1 Tax=Diploscapter pachys TaxID=2018661 RepID=A0A2A2KPM0_9BILA|nr:hypothetical protein WR25_01229 [Diploscapter pachys]
MAETSTGVHTISCPVCLDEYNRETNKPLVGQCGHSLCKSCYEKTPAERKTTCPVCNQKNKFVNPPVNFTYLDLADRINKILKSGPLLNENCAYPSRSERIGDCLLRGNSYPHRRNESRNPQQNEERQKDLKHQRRVKTMKEEYERKLNDLNRQGQMQDTSHNTQMTQTQRDAQVPASSSNPLSGFELTGLIAVAIFDYQKQDNDEISFEENDIITNIEQIDGGWWRGTCNGQHGLFPANFVELL